MTTPRPRTHCAGALAAIHAVNSRTLTAGAILLHPYWDVVTVIDLIGDIDPADPPPSADLANRETYVAAAAARL